MDDYTELLMPDDLLSQNSILAKLREIMTADACEDVEIIGWLYQFYISEKKDEVFAGLKKNVKVTPENIPAATQLFTPHWIVRYLVENSLGRLWLLNKPESNLADQMDYYIAPEEVETEFLRVSSPTELKVCDPACGSGHMLTYAFDLLYAIYEEEGYDATEIPSLILTHNLYGIEIDDRAGALAAFALSMKAANKLGRRRFMRMEVKPNICVLENVSFGEGELTSYMNEVGRDLFSLELRETLDQFVDAKNFGSLITPKLKDVSEIKRVLSSKNFEGNLFLRKTHESVRSILNMAEYLSPQYHVVVANPPYMGGKGMNGKLGDYAKSIYPDSKSDLFAMFMERTLALSKKHGLVAMINMQSWMFLSSYEKLRTKLLSYNTIVNMAHLGERAFDTIGGAVVSTTAFVIENTLHKELKGDYLRLIDGMNEAEKASMMQEAIQNKDCGWFFRASADDFEKIPGSPIAYWVTKNILKMFENGTPIGEIASPRQGLATSNNDRFLRLWNECSLNKIGFGKHNREEAKESKKKWFPYNKGGPNRRWFGNNEYVVNWENDGQELLDFAAELYGSPTRTIKNIQHYFKDSITWSALSSSKFSMRYNDSGFVFDTKGQCIFVEDKQVKLNLLGLLNSAVSYEVLLFLAPTLDFNSGVIAKIPYLVESIINCPSADAVEIAKTDWNNYETSWEFSSNPLVYQSNDRSTLEYSYEILRNIWNEKTLSLQNVETKNNQIFIDAYGLKNELDSNVALSEITLTCNPHYRYGSNKTNAELEELLRKDTISEFMHYAVGCMFGRYSLDEPGLILANQGDGMAEYLAKVPNPTFEPDDDNVIPVLEGDWFSDDLTERFRKFLRVTFGEENFRENLKFVEEAIGKPIRKFFTKDFYAYHVKMYKKRPIYWMFSSPKGTFNALIYMHRYKSDTVSVLLNDYLREFITKLEAQRTTLERQSDDQSLTQAQRTKADKEIADIANQIEELTEWERDVLFPLAQEQIEIDLDDGVKANYPKFGKALKKVTGLS
ncbi:MAG: BREX-1 system adenine-specific DNA-methyltransferase PglX [Rhodothermales bacterium]